MADLARRLAVNSVPVPMCGCLLWLGWVDRDGYGALSVDNRFTRAHRAAWEVANGPIPAGMQVLHRCDVRCCIEPAHLFLGTNRDNVDDMLAKGRQVSGDRHYVRRQPGLKRGERNGRARLSEADVVAIRLSTESTSAVARRFGISWSAADRARKGKAWGHVNG